MIGCEPPRLLEFLWGDDKIRLELEPVAQGTRLTLYDTIDVNGKAARDASGWHVCLDRLARLLGDAQTVDHPAPDWREVHRLYQQKFGPQASTVGPPEGHPEAS